MNHKIETILKSKWAKKELASFYIIEPSSPVSSQKVSDWLESLLCHFYAPKKPLNCSDLLTIRTKDKKYKVSDFNELINFMRYTPIEFGHKLVVIEDAEKISELILNKLLKTFEEPTIKTTLFLLNPQNSKLIPTVYSRAILLRPMLGKKESVSQINQFKGVSFHDFSEKVEHNELDLQHVLNLITQQMCQLDKTAINYSSVLLKIKRIEDAILYNNSKTSILQQIYELMCQTLTR